MSSKEDGSLERVPSDHIGPEYKSMDEKPKATVSKTLDLDNLQILPQTPQLIALLTYVPPEHGPAGLGTLTR